MSNRWGRPVQSKSGHKGPGQNQINININFNAVKQKTNAFTGKKIDNYIEVNNSPKNNASRPNVSMETLKQKKKKSVGSNDVQKIETKMQRKKSRSKIIGGLETPQKKCNHFFYGEEKSLNKKSTQKRNSKSHQKYQNMFLKKSSRSKSHSNSNSQSRSKSKSRSQSQSGKKYAKNISNTGHNFTKNAHRVSSKNLVRPHTADIYSKNMHKEPKQVKEQKNEKGRASMKKIEKEEFVMKRKKSEDNFGRKKVPIDQNIKKNPHNVSKIPKSRKTSHSTKALKPLPLVIGDDDSFEDHQSNKKSRQEAKNFLFNEKVANHFEHFVEKKKHNKETMVQRFMAQAHTYQDVKKLTEVAITIQRFWKGYKARSQFLNYLNLMHHKIQISKQKIAEIDPKFWDGASDSILHAQDQESEALSKSIGQLSQNQRVVSISDNKSTLSKELLGRMNRLQQDLLQQKEMVKKLEQQNQNLKQNLEKVSAMQSLQSANPSFQSSLKESVGDSWEEVKPSTNIRNKKQDLSDEECSQEFQLRLPKRINQKKEQISHKKQQKSEDESKKGKPIPNNQISKYKHQMEAYECSSPKHVTFTIDNNLMQLFAKKQMQLKETHQKKSTMYERMYHDKVFSPRTYSFKKNQLDETFKTETEKVKHTLQEAQRVANYIQEMSEGDRKSFNKEEKKEERKEQKKQDSIEDMGSPKNIVIKQNSHESNGKIDELSAIKPIQEQSEKKEKNQIRHTIQNYQNIDLHSHRSREQNQEDFNSSRDIKKPLDNNAVEKSREEIEQQNQNAIRIFQRVSEEIAEESGQSNDEEIPAVDQSDERGGLDPDEEEEEQVRPKGMETTLLFIKQYCVSFVEYIRSSPHKDSFIEGVCTPVQYDSREFLKSYRNNTSNQYDGSFNSHEQDYIYPYFKMIFPRSQVITRQAFNDFNQIYDKLQVECLFPVQRDYFLVSLLDGFNQSLDYQRPGSIYGKPPPWISEYRNLKNNCLNVDPNEREQIFLSSKFDEACGVAIARVIQWATCLCGFIPESPQMGDVQIGQQQITQIHESRMALMLEKDLLQNQQQILDSYNQQTEVKLYLSENLLQNLLLEFVSEYDFFK